MMNKLFVFNAISSFLFRLNVIRQTVCRSVCMLRVFQVFSIQNGHNKWCDGFEMSENTNNFACFIQSSWGKFYLGFFRFISKSTSDFISRSEFINTVHLNLCVFFKKIKKNPRNIKTITLLAEIMCHREMKLNRTKQTEKWK